MDYHADRFEDYSLVVFKKGTIVGIIPINIKDGVAYSHQGLSYGGLILSKTAKLSDSLNIFKAVLCHLNSEGFNQLYYKSLPSIYHHEPSDEVSYFLYVMGAQLERRDTLSVIDLAQGYTLSKSRKEGVKRGHKHQLEVVETQKFDEFWTQILEPNLKTKHGVSPVHSLTEITQLKSSFPTQIRQFNVYYKGTIVGGTTIFESQRVAHAQYISGNSQSNTLGPLDLLYYHLLTRVFNTKTFFDFGNSNGDQGRTINEGLLFWKEGFGARTISQDFYVIDTGSTNLIENIFQ